MSRVSSSTPESLPNSTYAIRPATADDIPALVVLAQDAFRDTYRDIDDAQAIEDYVRSKLTQSYFASFVGDPDASLLVVEYDAQLIGYALVARSPTPSCVSVVPAVELARLYLRQDAKGKGVGSALMHAVLAEARRFDACAIWLGVYDRNVRARAFYSRWGFVDVGTKGFMFGGQMYADPVMCRGVAKSPTAARRTA